MRSGYVQVLTLSAALMGAATTTGAEPSPEAVARARAIAPFLDELTVAVFCVDTSRIDLDATITRATVLFPEIEPQPQEIKAAVEPALAAFAEAGGKDVYMVVTLEGLPRVEHMFFFVIPLTDRLDVDAIRKVGQLLDDDMVDGLMLEPFDSAAVVGRRQTIQRLKSATPDARPVLASAFSAVQDAPLQALLLPPTHTRRVIEELMPSLPDIVGGGSSRVLTDGFRWAAVGLDLPPNERLRLVIQSKDAPAAAAFQAKWIAAVEHIGQRPEVRNVLPAFDILASLTTPRVDDDQVVLEIDGFAKIVDAARLKAEQID